MTDTLLLKKKIEESGLKVSFIAQYVGLSRAGLYKKINNLSSFTQSEIVKMCHVLQIRSIHEKEAIFFAMHVDD